MKFSLLVLSALTAVSASAAEIQMRSSLNVGLSLVAENPLSLRDAKCGFINGAGQSYGAVAPILRCMLPVSLPKVTGLGSETVNVRETLGDEDNKILPGLYRIESKISGQFLTVDFGGDLITQLLGKAFPYNPKDPDARQKRYQNLTEILITDRQLSEAEEPFKLGLQKTAFPAVFNLADDILKYLVENKKIVITQQWSLYFRSEESNEMIKSFCAAEKNLQHPTCKALSGLGK